MRKSVFFVFILITSNALSQQAVGVFEDHADIGNPGIAGTSVYDPASKIYTLKGSGSNIWFDHDEFQYAFKSIKGDFKVTATFAFKNEKGINPHRKIGWMIRTGKEANDVHYSAVIHGDGLTVLQWRTSKGAMMRDPQDEIFAPDKNYVALQLERKGSTLTMRAAKKDGQLQLIGSTAMTDVPEKVMVGLFISSHDAKAIEEANVGNVVIK